jgi:N-acetylglutamate synthase-like GNAT family acetyltransferase
MMTQERAYTLDDCKFLRLLVPRLIPVHLIQQVKGRAFSIEDFYQFNEEWVEDENPYSLIYALIDPDREIVGYLWVVKNTLENSLFINTFSVEKRYWNRGEAVKKAIDFLHELIKVMKIKSVLWMTTNPRFFQKLGFRRSRDVAMEFTEE